MSVMRDMKSWKLRSARWVNHTGPTRQPAISTSGTSIIAEPVPSCADSITRHSGCALRQPWKTVSLIMLVARCAGAASFSAASASGASTVIAPVSNNSGSTLPSIRTSMRG